MRQKFLQLENWLGAENYRSIYLAVLRVAISLWLLTGICTSLTSLDVLYSTKSFIVRNDTQVLKWIPGCIAQIRNHYILLVILYIIILMLNLLGIGRWATALILFLMVDIFYKLNMGIVNGGDKMTRLILLYLIFANSYNYFVLYKSREQRPEKKRIINTFSNLVVYSLMLQLCLVYFCAGVSKLYNELWRNGEATYYFMLVERFKGTGINNHLAQNILFVKAGTYFTLIFELSFPLLIWIKKLKMPMIAAGIILHIAIYIFLMLYGFEIIFILLLGVFFTNKEWSILLGKLHIRLNE